MVQHANGGGWKASTATVEATAFVGPNARVLGTSRVLGNARVEDFAVVRNNARLQDNAIARGHSQVFDNAVISGRALVSDFARVGGSAVVSGAARVMEHATMTGGAAMDQAVLKGSSGSWGGSLSGNAITEGEYGFARDIRNASVAGHLPWVGIPDHWLVAMPTGLFASYEFATADSSFARDQYAATDGILRGSPTWFASDAGRNGILSLNGSSQWIQLERPVAELQESTITSWVKWSGGAQPQTLLHWGDGNQKFISFTPRNANGVAELRASDGTTTYSVTANAALPVATWTQLGVALNGTTGVISFNGVVVGSGALPIRPYQVLPPHAASTPAHCYLGRASSGNFFQGSIDDVKVYSIAAPTFTLVSVEALDPTIPENAPVTTFRISRSALAGSSTSGNLTVSYSLAGTATAGTDYTSPTGSVTIPQGQSHVDVEIPLIHDTIVESHETIVLQLSPSSFYSNANQGQSTSTILQVGALAESVLAWYPFSETSGSIANDVSGKNQHANLINGPVWMPSEKALSFNDSHSGIDAVQTPVANGEARTLSAWFCPRSSVGIENIFNYNAVFDSDVPGAYGAGWGVVAGTIRVMLDDTMWDTGVTINLNQWQHGILAFDQTRARFYLNGVLRATFLYSQGGVTTANYTIGSKGFHGQIREARIYQRPVYSAEAQELYLSGLPQLPPVNLTALAGHGQVTLGWQPSGGGETSYRIRRSLTSGGPYTDMATVSGTSFVDQNLLLGTTYHYVVAGITYGNVGPNSQQVSATPQTGAGLPSPWQQAHITPTTTPITAPASTSFSSGQISITGGGTRLTSGSNTGTDSFRFLSIPVIGNCTITARLVSHNGSRTSRRAGVMIRESLTAGSRHASTLITPASSNNRQFLRRSSTNGNAAVSNISSTNTWVRVVRTGTTFASFTSSNGVNWTQLSTNQTISMSTNTVYYIGLAMCSGSASASSTAVFSDVTISGGFPTGLIASATNAQVALQWNSVAGATAYRVRRALTSGGPYAVLGTVTTNAFVDATALNDTRYFYVVSALNGTAESGNSMEVFATPSAPLASVPANLNAVDQGSSVLLSWLASTNASSYRISRSSHPAGPYAVIGTSTNLSYIDTNIATDRNFFYVVEALNSSNQASNPSNSVAVTRILFFDPNGSSPGSVASGSNHSWLGVFWAQAQGGNLPVNAWQSGKEAYFAASNPTTPLSYQVDITGFDTGSHGSFTGIRVSSGAVTLLGNTNNFYLTTPATFTADAGASLVFQQTRVGADVLAFNLNGQEATFHGDITINTAGIGNNGSLIVGSGHLKLGNAIANYSPQSTVLRNGSILTNAGAAGKSFVLGALQMNAATLAATNSGHASWGNYILSGGLTVRGETGSEISADLRCQGNTNQTLDVADTPSTVDLWISGRIGHINGIAWSHATKTGLGTMRITGWNDLGSLTVQAGKVILEGSSAWAGMSNGSLINHAEVQLVVPSGTMSYPRPLLGTGEYIKMGHGTLELTSSSDHTGDYRIQQGVLRLTQAKMSDESIIAIDASGVLDLAFVGTDTIAGLVIDGVVMNPGVYNAASHPDVFVGTGSLKVAATTVLTWNNATGTGIWSQTQANWSNQSWVTYADGIMAHANTPQIITLQGIQQAAEIIFGNGTNLARYTLIGTRDSLLKANAISVQGAPANDPGVGLLSFHDFKAEIAQDLRLGRWDLVVGGNSYLQIAGQMRASSDGFGSGDWGRLTLQDQATIVALGGVNGAGAAWGVSLHGGTLVTRSIRAMELNYAGGSRLSWNGTMVQATQSHGNFLTIDGTNQAYLGSLGARLDTNGYDLTISARFLDLPGQAGVLTKLGQGTLTMTGPHSHSGGTYVNAGVLALSGSNANLGTGNLRVENLAICAIENSSDAIADGATVELRGQGKLQIASGISETVRILIVDGVAQQAGVYHAGNMPNSILGGGSLIVTESTGLLSTTSFLSLSSFDASTPQMTTLSDEASTTDGSLDQDSVNPMLGQSNLNALRSSADGLPRLSSDGSSIVLIYQHPRHATDSISVVEVSVDSSESSWRAARYAPESRPDGIVDLIDDTHPDGPIYRFIAPVNSDQDFYRVRVLPFDP